MFGAWGIRGKVLRVDVREVDVREVDLIGYHDK